MKRSSKLEPFRLLENKDNYVQYLQGYVEIYCGLKNRQIDRHDRLNDLLRKINLTYSENALQIKLVKFIF